MLNKKYRMKAINYRLCLGWSEICLIIIGVMMTPVWLDWQSTSSWTIRLAAIMMVLGAVYTGARALAKNATMGYTGGIAWLIAIVAMAFSGILDTWSLIGVGIIALGIIIDLIRTRLNGEAVA